MLKDFYFACIHHMLAFSLVGTLMVESTLLSRPLDPPALKRLINVDAGYGITAGLLLVVGLFRVFGGLKGADFYLHNSWFYAKLAAFVLMALLSAYPTSRFLKWRNALRADPLFMPSPSEVARLSKIVRIERLSFVVILICAAGMARYGGMHF